MSREDLITNIKTCLESQTIETLYRIYNIINPEDTEDILEYLLDGRLESSDIAGNIITCLEKNNEIKMMSDFIRSDRLSIDDIVNGHNMIHLCMNPVPGIWFSDDTIKRFSREKDSGGVKIGEYEYLMRIFLNNIDIKDHRGDIVSGGKTLELKCGSARICGSKTGSPTLIREKLNTLLRTNYTVDQFNNGSIRSTPVFFKSLYLAKNDLANVIVGSYLAQYSSIPLIYKAQLIDFACKILHQCGDINALIVLTCLEGYRFSEDPIKGFDYFMIINNQSGEYKCFDMNDPDFFMQFYQHIQDKKIKILSLPNERDTMYGKGPRICFCG